jgi:hypothetical protein
VSQEIPRLRGCQLNVHRALRPDQRHALGGRREEVVEGRREVVKRERERETEQSERVGEEEGKKWTVPRLACRCY